MDEELLDLDDNTFNLWPEGVPTKPTAVVEVEQGKQKIEKKDLTLESFTSVGDEIPTLEDEEPSAVVLEDDEEIEEDKEKPASPAPSEPEEDEDEEEDEFDPELKGRLYSNLTEHFIKTGLFKDYPDRDKVVFDDERFAQEIEDQVEEMVADRYETIKNSNEVLNTIFEYMENDGDPSRIIELFNKQKTVQETFDLTTDDGKRGYILKYYTEVLGDKKTRAEVILNREEQEGEGLDAFFKEIEEKYDSHFQKEREAELSKQQEEKKVRDAQKAQLQGEIVKELKAMQMERTVGNELANFLLTPRHVMDGREITDLELAYSKALKDPKSMIKLAQFLKSPDEYDRSIAKQKQNEVVDKTFDLLRNNKPKPTDNRAETPTKKQPKFGSKQLQL